MNINKKMKSVLKLGVNSFYGLGSNTFSNLYKKVGVNLRSNPKKIKLKQLNQIKKNIKKIEFGKKLINNVKKIINFHSNIKTYKGVRHRLKYPIRGQRTHTNAKTRKKIKF